MPFRRSGLSGSACETAPQTIAVGVKLSTDESWHMRPWCGIRRAIASRSSMFGRACRRDVHVEPGIVEDGERKPGFLAAGEMFEQTQRTSCRIAAVQRLKR